mmetsp:Transcript_13038/g.27578  ORF Transcript_13038/g.27578 Transcript_13038/m.27578 type:complete len:158 (+) Transcript_13038:122-595(+)|eukprot:CAMPEP_0201122674 /NCGR_PEP_ID=MMETSP0850-20130426/6243_1 /ASSEMBLY_ACC=CAM_ASM_000622 /TAXON_ID=183588 /ORGANISM="Pseudo-nitzschia fraudulenta, Strain WWA7" /LENGTH=157 /DNA_ID=CAMNT_0047389407 /DNA_START=124 /DNA_END=597 /DNA_ORIENTATION=+
MANFRVVFLLLSSSYILGDRLTSAFLATTSVSSSKRSHYFSPILPHNPEKTFPSLLAGFEQLPGESNTDFIKRVTSQSNELIAQNSGTSSSRNGSSPEYNDYGESKPVGKYQRIEEWDAERNAKGELSWEEKVQFDGQRFGNQVKQDSILRRHLGTF